MSTRILLIEDDEKLGAQMVGHLQRVGLEVDWVRDGDAARSAPVGNYQLVILDLMLPGTYGLDLLKVFRASSDVPVLIVSARDDTSDKVRGLKLGADDYITKPFWPEELIARVNARLRRPDIRRATDIVRVGSLVIDRSARTVEVVVGEARITPDLTRVEFDILVTLASRPGSSFTRLALVDAALDPEKLGTERTLDVHVSRLRKKLGEAGGQIETVWGIGYKLSTESPS